MTLRKLWLKVSIIAATTLSASAQLALNPQDVWTNAFDDLPYVSEAKIFAGDLREGIFLFTIAPGSFEPGSSLRFEMFEGAVGSSVLGSGTITTQPAGPVVTHAPFGWQDRSGAVRFTMQAGSCTITNVKFEARIPSSATFFSVYATNFTPAPLGPRLQIVRQGSGVIISWWTNGASGFSLEATNVLQSGVWPAATNVPTVVGRRYVVTNALGGQQYFRLRN